MNMDKNLRESRLYEEKFRIKEGESNIRFYSILLFIITLLMAFHAYWTMNFGGVTVSGRSMEQTLQSGDQLLMKYVDGKEAKRGDVIVVYVGDYPEFQGRNTQFLIKRLIAIEGDHVKCTDGQISIKYRGSNTWVTLDEPYAYYEKDKSMYDFAKEGYLVGTGEIFFLGDNRLNSMDSRYKESGSHLNCLYKTEDIIGIVPEWAIEYRSIIEKLLFWGSR